MSSPLPPLPPPRLTIPEPRRTPGAGWLSLVLHLLVILVLVQVTRDGLWWQPPALADEFTGVTAGGGGNRQVTMVALPEPAPAEVTRVKPVPPPEVPVVTPDKVTPPVESPPPPDTLPHQAAAPPTPGTGGGSGGGAGTGSGPGTGSGSGPGTGSGTGTAAPVDSSRRAGRPPEPRQLILPPFDYPAVMRGRTIAVTFFVLADGRVDRVVFSEEIPDRGYAKKLESTLRAYRFRPARSPEGTPVPGVTTVSISF